MLTPSMNISAITTDQHLFEVSQRCFRSLDISSRTVSAFHCILLSEWSQPLFGILLWSAVMSGEIMERRSIKSIAQFPVEAEAGARV